MLCLVNSFEVPGYSQPYSTWNSALLSTYKTLLGFEYFKVPTYILELFDASLKVDVSPKKFTKMFQKSKNKE